MNLRDYLSIEPAVQAALDAGRPVVALPGVLMGHGTPWPDGAGPALLEDAVRSSGAVPAVIAVVDGVLRAGLCSAEVRRLGTDPDAVRASRRDLPVLAALGGTGAATVAAAMIVASLAGIRVLATDGVGGTDGAGDVSADLQELRKSSQIVVCTGINPPACPGATLEYLETLGVPVLGLGTAEFPAFYGGESGFRADRAASEQQIARIAKVKWDLGLTGGVLAACGTPAPQALASGPAGAALREALDAARAQGVHGSARTPWILARMAEKTPGARAARAAGALSSARAAGRIAAALARL